MADWAGGQVGPHFIPPGQPWRIGYVESFNSRIRDECLNINSLWSLAQSPSAGYSTRSNSVVLMAVSSVRSLTRPC